MCLVVGMSIAPQCRPWRSSPCIQLTLRTRHISALTWSASPLGPAPKTAPPHKLLWYGNSEVSSSTRSSTTHTHIYIHICVCVCNERLFIGVAIFCCWSGHCPLEGRPELFLIRKIIFSLDWLSDLSPITVLSCSVL